MKIIIAILDFESFICDLIGFLVFSIENVIYENQGAKLTNCELIWYSLFSIGNIWQVRSYWDKLTTKFHNQSIQVLMILRYEKSNSGKSMIFFTKVKFETKMSQIDQFLKNEVSLAPVSLGVYYKIFVKFAKNWINPINCLKFDCPITMSHFQFDRRGLHNVSIRLCSFNGAFLNTVSKKSTCTGLTVEKSLLSQILLKMRINGSWVAVIALLHVVLIIKNNLTIRVTI